MRRGVIWYSQIWGYAILCRVSGNLVRTKKRRKDLVFCTKEGERWRVDRKTTSPRAGGHAQLSDRSSERSVCNKEEDTTETSRFCPQFAILLHASCSHYRQPPLPPSSYSEKEEEKESQRERGTAREVKNGKRAQYSVVSSDEFSSAQREGGAERTLPGLSRSHLVAGCR